MAEKIASENLENSRATKRKAADSERLAIRFSPEERADLELWYKADDSASLSDFVRQAVRFYISYLKLGDPNMVLPVAVSATIDGKLDGFEDRMAQLLFKLATEVAMATTLAAERNCWSDQELEQLRASCAKQVRRSNGKISFKEIAQAERQEDFLDG